MWFSETGSMPPSFAPMVFFFLSLSPPSFSLKCKLIFSLFLFPFLLQSSGSWGDDFSPLDGTRSPPHSQGFLSLFFLFSFFLSHFFLLLHQQPTTEQEAITSRYKQDFTEIEFLGAGGFASVVKVFFLSFHLSFFSPLSP